MSGLTAEQRAIAARALHDAREELWEAELLLAKMTGEPGRVRVDPYAAISNGTRDLADRAAILLADGHDRPARDCAAAWKWLRWELTGRVTSARLGRIADERGHR